MREFDSRTLRERVLLELPVGRSPPQGAILALRVTIGAPRGAEDGFDERGWLARRGVHVVLHGGDWRIVGRRGGIGGVSDRLRAHVARAIAPGLGGERRAVLAGIVLGEDEGLTDELRANFKASGLYHLLAVSGQNVAFLAIGVLGLAWLLGIHRLAAEVAAIGAIGAYVLAVGLATVGRARRGRRWPGLTRVAARPPARSVALPRPRSCGTPRLDAGVPVRAGIPALLRSGWCDLPTAAEAPTRARGIPDAGLAARCARGVDSVRSGDGADSLAAVRNRPGLLVAGQRPRRPRDRAAASGSRWLARSIEPLLPSVALALAWVNGWLAAYIAACAELVAGLPLAQIGSGKAVCVLLGIPLALLALQRLPRWRRPAALACAATLVPVLLVWQLLPSASLPPPKGLRITFLDVGQGDSILLQVPEGAMLVDEGPPEANVAQQLRALGVRRLAAVVLTHQQRDHIGGAEAVLRRIAVDRVLDPYLARSSVYRHFALAEAEKHGVEVIKTRAGDTFRLGRLHLRVLWPNRPGTESEDPNRLAMVILATYGEVDALLTADAETDVTAPLLSRRIEILKVAHHGSADAGLASELRELRPEVAVISCGRNNDYGHPRPSTVAALRASPGLSLYRTDEDGRVVVESDGKRITVRKGR